jgi:aromatic-L-amino-acid decarboxylase
LNIIPEYLKNAQSDLGAVVDYRNWQIPLGRRMRALKLWFVIRTYGVKGLQNYVREVIYLINLYSPTQHIKCAEYVEKSIEENPLFELTAPRKLSLVCFRIKGTNELNKQVSSLAWLY